MLGSLISNAETDRPVRNYFLEAMQRQDHQESGLELPTEESIRDYTADLLKEYKSAGLDVMPENLPAGRALPTSLQDPIAYKQITELDEKLRAAARQVGEPIDFTPVLGTSPTGNTNARRWQDPYTGDPVIVFDSGLFIFAWLCAKAVSQILPIKDRGGMLWFSTEPHKIQQKVNLTDGAGMFRLRNALLAYIVRGSPTAAKKYLLFDADELQLAGALATSWELFALAHEYGHIALKHPLDSSSAGPAEESAADTWALERLYGAGQSRLHATVGAFLYLQCSSYLERAVSYMDHLVDEPLPPTGTHPPPRNRLHALLADSMPKDQRNIVDGLSFSLDEYFWPSMLGAVDFALIERAEAPHRRWYRRLPVDPLKCGATRREARRPVEQSWLREPMLPIVPNSHRCGISGAV